MCACDFDESKHHLSGGELLDDEKISEIINEVFSGATGKESEEKDTEIVASVETEGETYEQTDIVYWTDSGSVWHKSTDCTHIKNSTNLYAGTVAAAQSAGKSKACSRCYE